MQPVNINTIFTNHVNAGIVAATPASLISRLLPNIMALSGTIFFLMILGAGFMMVKNAGGSPSAQDTAKAKSALTMGVIGFLLVVSSYFILQIVQALTGVNLIVIPNF